MLKALEERRRERERLLAVAARYVESLARRAPVHAAAVAGSVARGDFNVWSDVDVVIVLDELPETLPERLALLMADRPAHVQPFGYTGDELHAALRKGNRLVAEAVSDGVPVYGGGLATWGELMRGAGGLAGSSDP